MWISFRYIPWQLQTLRLATFDSLHEQQWRLYYFLYARQGRWWIFHKKLHRTETLSYRGWNHTFEAFTLPTRPKNQYQNKTLEWDTLRTYSPVWTLTFLINTMYVTILPISFFFIQWKQKLGIGETRLYPTFAFKELSKPSPLPLSQQLNKLHWIVSKK